jgi:hypothetical protein
MAQSFIRYSPEVESTDPDFDNNMQRLLTNMERHMQASPAVEGTGRMVRDAHAKGYGLVRGEVEILGGLPREYAQGTALDVLDDGCGATWRLHRQGARRARA